MLREDGKLIATTRFDAPRLPDRGDAAERSKQYVRRHWKYREPEKEAAGLLERATGYALCISGMAFQDAWNIDMQRLRRCCIHVVTPRKKIIPFCSYYLTNSTGKRLTIYD